MSRQKIDMEETKILVLCYLYLHASKEKGGNLRIHEIYEELNRSVAVIDIAIDSLQHDLLCSRYKLESEQIGSLSGHVAIRSSSCARITGKGIEAVESWSDEFNDSIVQSIISSSNNADYESFLSNSDRVSEIDNADIPASDRYVTIDHNQKEMKEAIRTLDIAIQQFKEDKLLDNRLGQEKAALVGALEAGRKLLDDTKIWLETAVSILVQPLKRIAANYKEAAIQGGASAVINLALEQLLTLFGLE